MRKNFLFCEMLSFVENFGFIRRTKNSTFFALFLSRNKAHGDSLCKKVLNAPNYYFFVFLI